MKKMEIQSHKPGFKMLYGCSTGADLSVTKHFSMVRSNVYIVGKGRL